MNFPIHKTKMDIADFGFVSRQITYFCSECNFFRMVVPHQIENPKPKLIKLLLERGVWNKRKENQLKWVNKFDEELSKEKVFFVLISGEIEEVLNNG